MLGRSWAICAVAILGCALPACSEDSAANGGSGGSGAAGGDAGMPDAAGSDAGSDAPAPPYTVAVLDQVRINSDSNKENFQRATADFDFGAGPFSEVKLVADLGTTCFPFETWQDNPPPAGHNWPADCDAFDRNYEIVLDEPPAPGGTPGLELVRAITPFGGPLSLEIDVTDVANAHPGQHTLSVRIPTWSDAAGQVSGADGGWFVSARFEVTPGPAPRNVLAVTPLFYDSQTSAAPIPALPFETPTGTSTARIEYRVTGHGGVVGASGCGLSPAEEFCLRTHTLSIDGAFVTDFTPWRDDCATLCTLAHQGPANAGFDYCQENPCGAISSVQASRANWCPGSITPPFAVESAALVTPGSHDFSWLINDVAEGGSWRISATFFAYGP